MKCRRFASDVRMAVQSNVHVRYICYVKSSARYVGIQYVLNNRVGVLAEIAS